MLRFKDFLEKDIFMDDIANQLLEVSLIASMDDYIKKWAKRLFKVHPNPNKIKSGDGKKLHSQLIEELKGVGVTDLVNQAFRLLEFDATVQKEIILKGVNKNSAFGVTVATNLDDPTKLDNESELT